MRAYLWGVVIIGRSKRNRQHYNYLQKWLRIGTYAGGRCETCNERLIYSFQYDAVCCPCCNEWVDQKCDDSDCPFCGDRPDTPAEILTNEESSVDKYFYIKRYERKWYGLKFKQKLFHRKRVSKRR